MKPGDLAVVSIFPSLRGKTVIILDVVFADTTFTSYCRCLVGGDVMLIPISQLDIVSSP
jgi:hypothetical protein